MNTLSDEAFAELISRAIDELPDRYVKNLNNVVITYADEPNPEQRVKLRLRNDESLYGLYEGIPLTQRGAGYNLVLPDKITIFKLPMLQATDGNANALFRQVKHTLWHEVAHYYGLDHNKIHEIEARWQ